MEIDLATQLAGWDGLGVVIRRDEPTGAWVFIALHDKTLGPPTGGTRMKVYPSPADGLADAQRLAAGMTRKWAAIDLPFGGGKAVLALPRPLDKGERRGLLLRYAELVDALRGGFGTGPDLGTLPADMELLASVTPFVHGVDPDTGVADDPGPYTARGVFAGLRAAVAQRFGSADLAGRSVLVQGLGSVGRPLLGLLRQAGATLLVSDLDPSRADRVAAELGAEVVPTDEALTFPCDVFATCAIGGILDRESIPALACRVVAGSANNQLAEPRDGERLHRRGILYAPDFVVNGGGAIAFGLFSCGASEEEVRGRIDGIEQTLTEIFRAAERRGESPIAAAERWVAERVARRRRESPTGHAPAATAIGAPVS